MRPAEGESMRPVAGGTSGGSVTLLAVLVGVALTLTSCLAGPPAIADGRVAHGFSLPSLNSGPRITLSAYRDQPVILNFCAAWSPPCKVETLVLETFYRHHHGLVKIIGVDSLDSRAAGLRLLAASGVQYPVAYDPTQSVGGLYGVPGIPTTYYLNSQHQIVRTNLGWLSITKLRRATQLMDANSAVPTP
jgi:peroxiredoxin